MIPCCRILVRSLAVAFWVLAPKGTVLAADPDFLAVVRRYADTMIERGRDHYGPVSSGLFLSALDRTTTNLLTVRPAPPGGIRRGDRPGRPWSAMNGANPMIDQNFLRVLYALSRRCGDPKYAQAADEELTWFFHHTQSPVTGLFPWGEHLSWDVVYDVPISGGDEMMHEFARPWMLWDRCFELAPEASRRFALGLWEHQIADHQTGAYDRHAPYAEHGPRDGRDFPRHGAFYIATWSVAWEQTKDDTYLEAIEAVLARFERKRVQPDGSKVATLGPLDLDLAAARVPSPLAERLRAFAAAEDDLILPSLKARLVDGSVPFWQSGYSAGTMGGQAMFCLERYHQVQRKEYRELLLQIADLYLDAEPEEDIDVWPMTFSHAISTEVAAFQLTKSPRYLDAAHRLAALAVRQFWQDNPLPRASFQTGHYETITGADSLALALFEVHEASSADPIELPRNTIDR